jgi:tetratricopeptide (TPR) repeat protein
MNSVMKEFPAIPVSFFDVEAEKYVTLMTEPIAVTIREAETLSGTDIVSYPGEATKSSSMIEASEGGIFANDSSLSSLRNEYVRPVRWVAAWAGMLIAWAIASLAIRRSQRIREDPALQRRRSATTRVKSTLAEAATLLSRGSRVETCDAIRRAVSGLIADFANVSDAGLTPRDAAEQLDVLGIHESLRNRTVTLLNDCDAARYGAASEDVSKLHAAAVEVSDALLAELKNLSSGRTDRLAVVTTASLLLATVAIGGCSSAPDLEKSKYFQEVEQAFGEASNPDDFARVARMAEQFGDADFASSAVLYNQGNAWMRAGETGQAIASYRQAQRYRPRDAYLEANLKNALSSNGRTANLSMDFGVVGYVFFWQNWLSYPEKFALTTLLFATTLLLSLIGQLRETRELGRRVAICSGLLCLVFAASTALDWQRFDGTLHGVVAIEQAVARKGNSDSYDAAFKDALVEGTELVVLEERNGWVLVQIGDAGTGWLSDRDVVIY